MNIPGQRTEIGKTGGHVIGPGSRKYFNEVPGGDITAEDMQAWVTRETWPSGRPLEVGNGWRHNDIREMAYLYVWKAFDETVNELNREQESQ